jgi:hypothetical protein
MQVALAKIKWNECLSRRLQGENVSVIEFGLQLLRRKSYALLQSLHREGEILEKQPYLKGKSPRCNIKDQIFLRLYSRLGILPRIVFRPDYLSQSSR